MRNVESVRRLLIVLTAAYLMTGCKVEVPVARADVERESAPQVDNLAALVTDNTDFAFDMYRQIVAEQDGNLIFSPHSISLAFAMVYAGARGETATQMAETFHYTLPPEQLHPAFNALDLALQPPEVAQPVSTPSNDFFRENPADDLTLNIANAVWGHEGFSFEEAYLELLGMNYGAGVNIADFRADSQGAQQAIRQWVEEATGGRITDMPSPGAITPQTLLVLVNAIYFKGEWTWPFNTGRTHDGTFHLADGGQVTTPMMVNNFAYMGCGRGEDYYAIELTYGGSESAAMLILMPDTGTFHDFEGALHAMLFRDVLAGLARTNTLTFTMPHFNFESEIDLRETLSAMGMTNPFGTGADFTGISSDGGLLIDYAVHKATISVDEQGTEAAGVTSVSMAISGIISSCGSEVTVDRPFVFAIYDRDTQAILFLGRVMNPAE